MGKKRITNKTGGEGEIAGGSQGAKTLKIKLDLGTLFVKASYNNTIVSLADEKGNVIIQSSSGALGFKGAKKGTPYAAGKVGELLAERALAMGVKDINVVVCGVGAGRESAIRSFVGKGINILAIKDVTPVPFNGPKAPRPRRV